jgi:hypothetical protein
MAGRMVACEPPRLIEFDWGGDVIRIELEATEAGTRLTLSDTISEQGKSVRDAAGWHVCLEHLEAHLSGGTPPQLPWKPLFVEYGKRFGPKAATMGPPPGHPEAEKA